MQFFQRFRINADFLKLDPVNWNTNDSYLLGKQTVYSINVVNDSAERAVKLMEDYYGTLTVGDEKAELLLRCVQEHRRIYPNCNKKTLKKQF